MSDTRRTNGEEGETPSATEGEAPPEPTTPTNGTTTDSSPSGLNFMHGGECGAV